MSQRPEQDFCLPVYPTVEQRLERTIRQYEATIADIVRRLGGTEDSDAFICPFCKGHLPALPSCNHSSPVDTQHQPKGNGGDYPRHGSFSTPNSYQLDEVLRTMSPEMRQYVMSLEEAYQKKIKEAGTDEIQNLQQHMINMVNSQPDSRFAWNPPRPATSTMGTRGKNGGQPRVNSNRSGPSPRKSGGIWAAMRRK